MWGVKLGNAIFSLNHEVYSIVLKDPKDKISSVKYFEIDINNPSPFEENYFDVFISPATLHLVGLGRYGDKLSPKTLFNFLGELRRVMKRGSHLFICVPLGKDALCFNHHFIWSFNTILKLFSEFELVDYLVDEWAGVPGYVSMTDLQKLEGFSPPKIQSSKLLPNSERFSKNTNVENLNIGEYKIIYLHFRG